ncbi:MAG: hypothetical protein JRG87_12440 [Deltaproteobacteria bacterium]|nr:hypothetical protein [Deltaproteobacteria bacterium]
MALFAWIGVLRGFSAALPNIPIRPDDFPYLNQLIAIEMNRWNTALSNRNESMEYGFVQRMETLK